MQKQLTILKQRVTNTFLKECNSQILQIALRQLATVFDNFFSKNSKFKQKGVLNNPLLYFICHFRPL